MLPPGVRAALDYSEQYNALHYRTMIEIITVGDELTSGSTPDENACFIARALYAAGFETARITTVGDAIEDIRGALTGLIPSTRFVVITGGLGPTDDDRTARAAARAFGRRLQENREALLALEDRYRSFGRPVPACAARQARLPRGCRIIPNPVGTASGFLIEENGRSYFFLPGVPEEVRVMVEPFVVEQVKRSSGSRQVICNRTLKVFGLGETAIRERLDGALPGQDEVSLAFYPRYPEVSLRITAKGSDEALLNRRLDDCRAVLHDRIGDFIYADTDTPLEAVVGGLLQQSGATLAVAESCTGGLITHRLTNISGSSAYLDRSFVVYSNRAKTDMLGVPPDMLERNGAVSEPVARCMAEGARSASGARFGLAVTGIAGPGGGSGDKPVGTVFIGVSGPAGTRVTRHLFPGTRQQIKLMSAQTALSRLREALLKSLRR